MADEGRNPAQEADAPMRDENDAVPSAAAVAPAGEAAASDAAVGAAVGAATAADDDDNAAVKALCDAARCGDVAEIERILQAGGVDVNGRTAPHGRTALHLAEDPKVVDALLKAGADVDAVGLEFGETPLMLRVAQDLIEISDDDDDDDDDVGGTIAFFTSERVEVVKCLLEHGASVISTDKDGETPLHYAAEGKIGVWPVEELLRRGADANRRNARGLTPLHIACGADSTFVPDAKIVKALLAAGADASAADNNWQRPLHCLSDGMVGLDSDSEDEFGDDEDDDRVGDYDEEEEEEEFSRRRDGGVLHRAKVQVLRLLKGKGADVNATDCDGRTPLHLALACGDSKFAAELWDSGARAWPPCQECAEVGGGGGNLRGRLQTLIIGAATEAREMQREQAALAEEEAALAEEEAAYAAELAAYGDPIVGGSDDGCGDGGKGGEGGEGGEGGGEGSGEGEGGKKKKKKMRRSARLQAKQRASSRQAS